MPKRVGYLYQWMCDREHIREAIRRGAKHKRKRSDVAKVLKNEDYYVEQLYAMLINRAFVPQIPRCSERYDTSSRKWREIEYVKFFPDGIIHTLMVMAMSPVLMRGMYRWCCASIPGRGSGEARKYCRKVIDKDPKRTKYVLKLDIQRFYHSVDREILLRNLSRKIKDREFIDLVGRILETCKCGLAIGFYICQWLANFYLEPLDRFIASFRGSTYMVRYMDDIVVFGSNKRFLHIIRSCVNRFIRSALRLRLKRNWQVFPLYARALDFVGYRFFINKTCLRRRNFLKLIRQARRIRKRMQNNRVIKFHTAASFISRIGLLKHCDQWSIKRNYLQEIDFSIIKEAIRYEVQRICCTGCCAR